MIKNFFKRDNTTTEAAVFIDFEHWCYSLSKLYMLQPQITEFYTEIAKEYDVKRIYFFGDFTNPQLRSHIDEIRKITNYIIDTQNPSNNIKKNFTDFIMLDFIYQDIDQYPKTSTYIIFSGDGHFSSVTSYLKTKKKKTVIIYGISKATSNKLKTFADKCIELPTTEQERRIYYDMILRNMDYIAAQNKIIHATFTSTVKNICLRNQVDENKVKAALCELINMGIIVKQAISIGVSDEINVLKTNWELAVEKGLWNYNNA